MPSTAATTNSATRTALRATLTTTWAKWKDRNCSIACDLWVGPPAQVYMITLNFYTCRDIRPRRAVELSGCRGLNEQNHRNRSGHHELGRRRHGRRRARRD